MGCGFVFEGVLLRNGMACCGSLFGVVRCGGVCWSMGEWYAALLNILEGCWERLSVAEWCGLLWRAAECCGALLRVQDVCQDAVARCRGRLGVVEEGGSMNPHP